MDHLVVLLCPVSSYLIFSSNPESSPDPLRKSMTTREQDKIQPPTALELAYKDAVKGGWQIKGWELSAKSVIRIRYRVLQTKSVHGDWITCFSIADFLMEPEFWQALGKARGWSDSSTSYAGVFQGWRDKLNQYIDELCDEATRPPKSRDVQKKTEDFFAKLI